MGLKKIIAGTLLAGVVWGSEAQNIGKMTEEEKKQTLEALETLYRMETAVSPDAWREVGAEREQQVESLPWERWVVGQADNRRDVVQMFGCFGDVAAGPSHRSERGNTHACEVCFRTLMPGAGNAAGRRAFGVWDRYCHFDEEGNCVGFRKEAHFGLDTDLRIRLTDKEGRPVGIDTGETVMATNGQRVLTDGDLVERWFGFEIPLTAPWADVAGGQIEVRIYAPQEYDRVEIPLAGRGPGAVEVSLGRNSFTLERTDGMGFVISADEGTMERLGDMKYLYRRGNAWYEPTYSISFTGDLDDVLGDGGGSISFEAWLEKRGVDPDRLEETLEKFRSEEADAVAEDSGVRGRRYDSGMGGETLLLYQPADSADARVLVSARIPVPATAGTPEVYVDKALCAELIDRLNRVRCEAEASEGAVADELQEARVSGPEEDPVAAMPDDEVPEIEAAAEPEEMVAAATAFSDEAAPRPDLPRPGDRIEGLDPIVYAICYTVAYDMYARNSVGEGTYRSEYAPYLRRGYAFGERHWKEIVSKDFSALNRELRRIAETSGGQERSCFHAGALMGAYSPDSDSDSEPERIDAAIAGVLKQGESLYGLSSGDGGSGLYYSRFEEWSEYLWREMDRIYDQSNRSWDPGRFAGPNAFDALIRPEWIDTTAVGSGIPAEAALASAVAKFEAPEVPDGIRRLKEGMRLTPAERNALLAPNDRISYAAGVVQAERMMEYKWFVSDEERPAFDAVLRSSGGRPAVIAAFEAGLCRAVEQAGRFREAVERRDSDALGLLNRSLKWALNKARRENPVSGRAFRCGVEALDTYRAGAAWDIPERQVASGLNLDVERAVEGFRDYLEGRLKMGVAYARTLTMGRNAVDWHRYEADTDVVDVFGEDFRIALPIDPQSGRPDEWHIVFPPLLRTPEEAVGQGISGRVTTRVVIEADGAVSHVEVADSPHPILSETVVDCICRVRFTPAMYRGRCVAFVMVFPVLFD